MFAYDYGPIVIQAIATLGVAAAAIVPVVMVQKRVQKHNSDDHAKVAERLGSLDKNFTEFRSEVRADISDIKADVRDIKGHMRETDAEVAEVVEVVEELRHPFLRQITNR